eukprot:gene22093-biopygen30777
MMMGILPSKIDHCADSDSQPAEIQDFFTNRFDDVDWRPGNDFFESQALTYAAAPACVLPIGDPQGSSTPVGLPPAASLLPGRLQNLASCLNHMDPNFLQEGGINNSMPDGAVTPNPDRGAIHPDCDLFIGHHRDGTEAERSEMAAMLNKYTAAVARTMEDLREGYKGCVPPLDIKKDNDTQAFTSPYRKPPIEKLAQDKVCAELQMLHFIEPAPSAPHAANAVVALKKGPDGQYTANRVCYNYKAINLLTKDMHTEASQDFSAFWWDKQLYRFKRVPFGLKQAPAYFQKVMETELGKRGLLKFCKVFIDDILIHSATFAEHIRHVEAVLQCLIEVGLRIHPDKSCFAQDAVDFLGFDVSNHGLTPQQAKVQAIKDLPYPANLKDLKTVLGKLRYYGCFCEKISAIARPLNDLTKADVKWTWGPEQAAAMDKIRGLISTPGKVLRRFNVEARTLIHCDWSKHGLGAVLGQLDAEATALDVLQLQRHRRHRRMACMMQSFDFDIMHRPGAQHGNADALSRFPTPRQEDNTGARIDRDADLYAAFPAVRYITYKPLTLTLGCTVDAVLQVREVLSICTKPLTSAVAKMVQSGVTLYEMCGGLCAGLEATLRNGIRVNRYLYSDTAPAAQTVARFRTQALLKLYPHLLQPYACDGAFTTLPQDVKAITPQHLMDAAVNDQTQWLIITGPECQDFSPAGSNRGLRGPRAAVLQACTTVIGYVQQLQHPAQPLYIIENAAMQHNFRSPAIATEDFTAVNITNGQPICVDAATFNSGAHRLRNKWQNLVDPFELQRELNTVRRTANISANAFLDPRRSTTRVYRSDAPPFCLANKIGQPRTALPTLVAYPLSRAFLPDKPGSIYSLQGGAWSEPRPDERERMLGYYTGATAAPGLTALQRHVLTGNCMDQRALVAIIRTSVELAAPPRLTALLAYQPPIRPQLLPASTPVLFLTTVPRFPHSSPAPSDSMPSHSRQFYGTELACMLAVTRNASAPRHIQPAFPPPSAPPATPLIPTLAPGKQLDADIRLADMAKESEPLDIHDDQFVLEYLRRKVLGTNWSVARTRRVLARSRKYKLGSSPTGAEKIIRILANTMERIVPAPSERATIIQRAHEASGHFGARRTAYLVVSSFWWQGVVKQVKALVKNCKVCDQALAYFNQPTATLQSHPIHGLFFAWGIDLSGPYIKTARGNTYLMHAIEYFSAVLVVVPIPAKEAAHTMYAHAHGVLAHYGTHAVAITDNGPEFLGKFKEHLTHNFIDHRTTHPNHPQGNGFVERSVGTIKAALTKICSEHLSTDTWDIDIAKVVMAYNCSPHETTKCAPFTLLYARAPVMNDPQAELAMTTVLPDLTDIQQTQALVSTLLERTEWIKRVTPTIANHIAIAHHRDTLRYAKIRGGAYHPLLRKFQVGDFVYIRRPNLRNTLQMAAQGMILQIKAIKDTEVVVLQGHCGCIVTNHARNLSPCHLPNMDGTIRPDLAVPPLDLACSVCNFPDNDACMLLCDSSVPLDRPTAPERAPKEPNLFPTPQTRSRDLAAKACDQMVVIKHIKVRGSLDKEVWGIATYLGALARPWYFTITYDDGQEIYPVSRHRHVTVAMAENMPSSDFPDFPTIYMDPSVQAGIYSCLPQDGSASAFISHQSPPYTGYPVVGRKHLCFGPCFYGDTDSSSGEVLQLPSETAITYDHRILFLQAAWLFQQGMLFQILLKWEDAQPTGPKLPHPFQPNHPRRLPGPAWDAATPLTCLLSAAQAQSPHRTDLPSKPFQVTQRLFHHIRRLANLIWAYDNTQVHTLTVWRVIRFQSALVDAHATALTLHPAMFLTARHPAAPVSDLRLYTDDISVPFDALDLALLRLPFPGSFTPLLNFPFFRQHILAMLQQDGFGPDRVTPGTPQRTAAQDIQGVFGDTAHLGN